MTVVFVGDTGTEIILDCGTALASATVRQVIARTPRGTKKTWTATQEGLNSIKYTTAAGDLDQPGEWRLQAYIEMPGWKGFGDVVSLTVKAAL